VVRVNERETDEALVDVGLVRAQFVGSRAVWDTDTLCQVFVTRAQPSSIGLSAVVGVLNPIAPTTAAGAAVTVQPNGRQVLAPIAPGRIASVHIGELIELAPGVACPVQEDRPAVLALDGEREINLRPGDQAVVTLRLDGPWMVDVDKTLLLAVAEGVFEM
jgi:hypothetical protein